MKRAVAVGLVALLSLAAAAKSTTAIRVTWGDSPPSEFRKEE